MSKLTTKIYTGSFSDAEPDVLPEVDFISGSDYSVHISNTVKRLKCAGREDGNSGNEISGQLAEVKFGNDISEIEDGAFEGCRTLKSVRLNRNVSRIGENTFKDCESLDTINLDDLNLNRVGSYAFSNTGIGRIQTNFAVYDNSATRQFSDCGNLAFAEITSNAVPPFMFENCGNLTQARLVYSNTMKQSEMVYQDSTSAAYLTVNASEEYPLFGEYPFDGCGRLSCIQISGFSGFSLDYLTKGLNGLALVDIDPSAEYSVPDSCFSDNGLLSDFTFGEGIGLDDFSENALSGSSLTSIILNGIKSSELTSGQRIDFDVSENMISDYSTEHRLPYELYEHYHPGDMTGKQLYYGCIYDDLCACVDFCTKNSVPLILIYSRGSAGSFFGTDWQIFGLNVIYQHYKYQLWQNNNTVQKSIDISKMYETSTLAKKLTYDWISNQPYIFCVQFQRFDFKSGKRIRYVADLKHLNMWYKTDDSWNAGYPQLQDSNRGLTIWTQEPGSNGIINLTFNRNIFKQTISGMKGEWESKTLYLKDGSSGQEFIIDNNSQPPQYPKFLNVFCKAEEKLMICKEYQRTDDSFIYPWGTFGGTVLIAPDRRGLVASKKFYSAGAGYGYTEEYRINGVNAQVMSGLKFLQNKIALDFFNIEYDLSKAEAPNREYIKNLSNSEKDSVYADYLFQAAINTGDSFKKIQNILIKYNAQNLWDARLKALGFIVLTSASKNSSNNIYKNQNHLKTSYIEQCLRLNIKSFDARCQYVFGGYVRDPKFNRPGYAEKPVDLSFVPVKYTITDFNCWGIGHDCIITDADGVRCRWDFKRQKLVKL